METDQRNIYSSLNELVSHLELSHHIEGGYYRETYRSEDQVETQRGLRPKSTNIHYCLPSQDYSVWHKLIDLTEAIHFHYGDSVTIYTVENRKIKSSTLDNKSSGPFIVTPNTWFAIKPRGLHGKPNFSLMSCACEPGFDYSDLVIADNDILNEIDEEFHGLAKSLITHKEWAYIVYKNYRGVTSQRKIIPKNIWFGATEWHPEEQYLLNAFDIDKNANRSFAMSDIISWSKTP